MTTNKGKRMTQETKTIMMTSVAAMHEVDKYAASKDWVLESECTKTRKYVFVKAVN
jgi:hypothetical protein